MSDEQSAPPEFGASPGALLRSARQQKGLSVQQVATGLNLKPETVEDLEGDRYDRLPPRTFVKGYLKAYARLVDIKEYAIIAALDRHMPEEAPVTLHTVARRQERDEASLGGALRWLMWLVLLGGLALVAANWAGWLNGTSAPPSQVPSLPQDSGPAALPLPPDSGQPAILPLPPDTPPAPSVAPDAGQSAPSAAAPPAEALAPAAPAADATVAAVPVSEPAPVAEAPVVTAPGKLVVEVQGESWLQVLAANGARRYSGTVRGPRTLTLDGPAPFAVTIGDASQVRLRYQGEDVPVPGGAGRVARLTVGR